MKNYLRMVLAGALIIMILLQLAACRSPVSPEEEVIKSKPTIPENVAEGIEYLYDFYFSERYDDEMIDDFSLVLSDKTSPTGNTLFLFEKYRPKMEAAEESLYDGDGMVPHMYKRYWYTFETGQLMVGTDYYQPDEVEYISFLWSDIEGVKTNRNVVVGSTEKDLLSAYIEDLYYLDKEEAFSEAIDEGYDFDHAYFWQPFTPETNETRDITFFIKDSKVVAIETVQPFELRHVYGYDRDAGLQYTEEQREK